MTSPESNYAVSAPPDQAGYPPPAPPTGAKSSAPWTGILLALGGLITAVGPFLTFEKFVVFYQHRSLGTTRLSGLGSESRTGRHVLATLKAGNGGKIILAFGVLLLVAGVLILARKSKLWVSIVAFLVGAVALVLGLAGRAVPKDDARALAKGAPAGFSVHGFAGAGLTVAIAGAVVAMIGALAAMIVRKRAT